MKTKSFSSEIGIGATDELSLRVSVASLVRVLFENPTDGKMMLALEGKATLAQDEGELLIQVKAQPFGGAVRILDLTAVRRLIADFQFDSEESRAEHDFRIFIRPADWERVREFCLSHLGPFSNTVLETDPTRELKEEVADTLGMSLKPDRYTYRAMGTIMEEHPSPTKNVHARGHPTARMYRIFEARILDPALASAMIENSERWSDQRLRELALQDSQNGGPGRANAVLTLPLKEINAFYRSIPLEARNQPVFFQSHQLDETVAAILESMPVPKYRRL